MVIQTIRCNVPQCLLLTSRKSYNATAILRDDVCYSKSTYTTTAERLSTTVSAGRWQRFQRYITSLRPLRIGAVGLVLVAAAFQWRLRQPEIRVAKKWEITCYRLIPLRASSRAWGWLTNIQLPRIIRPWVYGLYSEIFGCKLEEACNDDLSSYSCLADFFCRELKDGIRPIDPLQSIVSPADGCVLNFGRVNDCYVDQVKGIKYSIPAFLGEPNWTNKKLRNSLNSDTELGTSYDPTNVNWDEYKKHLLQHRNTDLFQLVLYLAPGDYHHFHSPAQWNAKFRRHFQGDLLSVSPRIARWIPDLFTLNERAVYVGDWKHGFFCFGAVGATNVGNIRVACDETLHTNTPRWPRGQPTHRDKFLGDSNGILISKGEHFGEFRLGSTVVLIFEAPKDFKFNLEKGQHINMGVGLTNEFR